MLTKNSSTTTIVSVETTKLLQKIGFEPQEAKVYLAVLTLGEATVTDIAKHAGVVRTSCYYTLQKLQQKRIAHPYVKRGVHYWGVEEPQWLSNWLNDKKATLDYIMPELMAMHSTFGAKPSFTYYEGIQGVKQILQDILQDKNSLQSMSSMEDALALLGRQFRFFITKRVERRMFVQFITNRSAETEKIQLNDGKEHRHTHFLPPGKKIKNMNYIYGDKIAILSLNKKMPMGVIIKDPDVAYTQRILFEALWQQCYHYSNDDMHANYTAGP